MEMVATRLEVHHRLVLVVDWWFALEQVDLAKVQDHPKDRLGLLLARLHRTQRVVADLG